MTTAVVAGAHEVLAAGPDLPLSPSERARADALRRRVDRDAFVAARLLTRVLVGRHVDVPPADVRLVQVCPRCGGPHGRPRVVDLDVHVGWAHSGGVVAAVVDDAPCAVDVESLADAHDPTLEVLAPAEQAWLAGRPAAERAGAFASLWVRKEVLVKLGDVALDDVGGAGGVDVLPSLSGRPVLGRTLHPLDPGPHAVVAAWATTATPAPAPG